MIVIKEKNVYKGKYFLKFFFHEKIKLKLLIITKKVIKY